MRNGLGAWDGEAVAKKDSHLGDLIEDKNAILPIDAAIQSNLRETTTRVLASLTPREERVLRMRFGIGINTDHTLEEVGQQFSVTRERIRQIEAKALRKLKHPSRSRCVHDTIRFIKSVERIRGPGLALAPTAMTGMNDQWCSDQTISDLPARASAFHVQLHRGVIVSAFEYRNN